MLGFASENRVRLLAQGANTGLVGASTPHASGEMLVLSLERLTRPLEIDAVGRTVVAGGGVLMSQLDAALEPHGLMFPIDLGADPTVGGMVVTNTGGTRLLRYGDVRQNLLGIEVVLADGSVLDLMTALRKNNTGLDAKQLFVGTSGVFGIVTRALLRAVSAWVEMVRTNQEHFNWYAHFTFRANTRIIGLNRQPFGLAERHQHVTFACQFDLVKVTDRPSFAGDVA